MPLEGDRTPVFNAPPTYPARFRREGGSTALGCLVYGLAVPVLALFVGLVGFALLTMALKAAGLSETSAAVMSGAAALAAAVLIGVFGYRNFRSRAFCEVAVYADRVEVAGSGSTVLVPFSSVSSVALEWSGSNFDRTQDGIFGCVLTCGSGRRVRLPVEVASYERIRDVLGPALVAGLAGRLDADVSAGRGVAVRDGVLRAWGLVGSGLGLVVGAPFLVLLRFGAVSAFSSGCRRIRQGWRARRGGFVITAAGLRPSGRPGLPRWIPWEDVRDATLDDDGIVIRSRRGYALSASPYAVGFWPARLWLAARLRSGGTRGDETPVRAVDP